MEDFMVEISKESIVKTNIDFNAKEFRINPFPTYKKMRENHPVCQVEPGGLWAISRYEDIQEVLQDHKTFSSSGYKTLLQPPWLDPNCKRGDFLVLEDPPDHTNHRALVNKAFVPRIINALIPLMTETSSMLVEKMAPGSEVEFVGQFSLPYIGKIIGRIVGTEDTQSLDELRTWVEYIETIPTMQPDDKSISDLEACLKRQNSYFEGIIQSRKESPGDDLVSELISAEVNGGRLSDDLLRQSLDLFVGAGLQTTVQAFNNSIIQLSKSPEIMEKLHHSPDLIPEFIEEMFRFNPSAHCLLRKTMDDVEVRGITIPSGSLVLIMLASANRDEAYFPDPDKFDMSRDNVKQNLAFGVGIHHCIGEALARLELKVGLEIILKKFSRVSCPPDDELEWVNSFAARGVTSLPVYFS
jgi:cytochrome P450